MRCCSIEISSCVQDDARVRVCSILTSLECVQRRIGTIWRELEHDTTAASQAVYVAASHSRSIKIARCVKNHAAAWNTTIAASLKFVQCHFGPVGFQFEYCPTSVRARAVYSSAKIGFPKQIAILVADHATQKIPAVGLAL